MIKLCVCGYYVYKDIWGAAIGKELSREREPRNIRGGYAVAVENDRAVVIGHIVLFAACLGNKIFSRSTSKRP